MNETLANGTTGRCGQCSERVRMTGGVWVDNRDDPNCSNDLAHSPTTKTLIPPCPVVVQPGESVHLAGHTGNPKPCGYPGRYGGVCGEHYELTPVDHARVTVATLDKAAGWFDRPPWRFQVADVARYVAETTPLDVLPMRPTYLAVRALLEARPEVLTFTTADIVDAQQVRAAECARLSAAAAAAFKAGDHELAGSLIDEAELVDPDYRTDRGRSWSTIRAAIARRAGR